jgi:hypothetical protein
MTTSQTRQIKSLSGVKSNFFNFYALVQKHQYKKGDEQRFIVVYACKLVKRFMIVIVVEYF